MRKLRMMSMVFTCLLAAGLAVPANAKISDNHPSDRQVVTGTSQQAASTGSISDEVLLLGAAVIGLVGISIMRKTLP